MPSEASVRSSEPHDPDTTMAAAFELYPAGTQSSDAISRHWELRRAVKQLNASLEDVKRQLDTQLSSQLSDDKRRLAASEPNDEPTIVPQKFTRRVTLPTNLPLYVGATMRLNKLYHAESKVLETSQDITIHCMLEGMALCEGDNPISMDILQQLNSYHKELRRYRTSRLAKQKRKGADLHQEH